LDERGGHHRLGNDVARGRSGLASCRPAPARAAWYACIAGTFAALGFGILYGSVFALVYEPSTGLLTGLAAALAGAALAWMNTGGMIFLHHFLTHSAAHKYT
jgi:hypothetical protein